MDRFTPLTLAAPLLAPLAVPAAAAGLDAYLWKFRPIVVFAPSRDAPQAAEQLRRFEAAKAELAERDMPVLLVTPSAVTTASSDSPRQKLDAAALRRAYGVSADSFAVVLVGKDGGEKLRAEKPVEAQKLTALVDTMPMRARETR